MTDTASAALITAGASLIVALASCGIAWWNNDKTNKSSLEIQKLKGDVDRDLEKLKAKLLHGQIISSTQWNAEFASYQAIWKGMVAVRTLADKIVLREREMVGYGVPAAHLDSPDRNKIMKELLSKFVQAAQVLLMAIHDNAPFYPSPIREAANKTHCAVKGLIEKRLVALTALLAEGTDITNEPEFIEEGKAILALIIEGVDRVESLIRARLAAVEVINHEKV